MKKISKFIIFTSIFLILIAPALSFAAQNPPTGLVPCMDGKDCDFGKLMLLIDNVIKFILFKMAIPIAAIMFAYAGFELVTSGGSTEKRGIAKKVFTNTALGLIIAVAAWLIIKTILSILGYEGVWIGF
ncbi:MAG: hypothetical protein UW07_C0008G0017 [Candidatus Nomurabacteria bacterium GW2011_GWF2_43_8]|uniref:TrbC/VIRB2 family protein n=3 Tax=Candidatus Nomuraibacteriota TaxID=1752729 RepID=A0A0G1FR07_9BACT|nr:MAG: hypothetical protein UV76_C0015G0002 [Candidatus Nomurabacteria bacterium GW2011_GWA2_43_15]KKT19366.1 MAG: hypothetical protein UW02_C0011G0017 [Candidatus Nomurabacteria bacterium GW2011_GWB1_43_7]KKT24795.1 MAG: hypothetical protein UW07_C0008G0017 [Candidatus Nomurabacteria bacterium GW2011_GWF2_43_8]